MKNRKIWTDSECHILMELFSDSYTADICKILNKTYSSVSSKASLLGLKKSESFIQKELIRQSERLKIIGKNTRFNKNNPPANKGKKMDPEVYEKVKQTFFSKGHIPANTKYDGHERISKDGYVETRIKKGKYVLKHRYIWEQNIGKIPKDHILIFKDKNPLNIQLDNLELITKKENMLRNTIRRFPPELICTIKLVSKLKRNISNAKK